MPQVEATKRQLAGKRNWQDLIYRQKLMDKLIGHKVSQETRMKISKANKGKTAWNKGRYWNNEEREKCKNKTLKTGSLNGFYGRKHSIESKQKSSISHMKYSQKYSELMKIRRQTIKVPFKDSKPERMMQIALTLEGLKFRKHEPITGQPDIFVEPNICIFVDGCYFHGCTQCYGESILIQEIPKNNLVRDQKVNNDLMKQGNIVLRIWEHDILKNIRNEAVNIMNIINQLKVNQYTSR